MRRIKVNRSRKQNNVLAQELEELQQRYVTCVQALKSDKDRIIKLQSDNLGLKDTLKGIEMARGYNVCSNAQIRIRVLESRNGLATIAAFVEYTYMDKDKVTKPIRPFELPTGDTYIIPIK